MISKKIKLYFYSIFVFLIIFTFWFISRGGLILPPVAHNPLRGDQSLAQQISLFKQGMSNLVRALRGQALILQNGQTKDDIRQKYLQDLIERYKDLPTE